VACLKANVRPGEKSTPSGGGGGGGLDRNKRGTGRDRRDGRMDELDRSSAFGSDMKAKKKEPGLKPSEKGYRITEASGRDAELERRVRSLLNKICPENLTTIVERLALIELNKAEELEFVIRIIFGKALAEPHYCETYADMVFALRTRYPEFPAEVEGEKAHTFTRLLLNTCQNEFESLPTSFEPNEEEIAKYPADELKLEMKRRKDKMLANMKFIGNLFLRQLLAVKVIGQVVHDLIGLKQGLPEEHMIECVCELLQAIGYTLDATSHGKMLMSQFSARLVDLKGQRVADGKSGAFSKRVQFQIQDLLDLRSNNWQKKLFKEQAKTKEDVRKDAIKEARQQAKGVDTMFTTATVGMRPSYIDEFKLTKPEKAKPAEVTKPTFDQAYVKRLFQYYAEERNVSQLEADWTKAAPSTKESKAGVGWLLDIGFNDAEKKDIVAETIVEAMNRKLVTWPILQDALAPYLEGLEDMRMDVPHAPVFFHVLVSRLMINSGPRDFNSIVLKALPMEPEGFAWGLIIGALRKVKEKGGADLVKKMVEVSDFNSIACKAARCQGSELKRHLQDEGVL